MSDRLIIAKDGWGVVPDWIEVLIAACDKPGASQSKVAQRLGRTGGVVSQVISNKYKGNMKNIEARVRDVLCPEQVECPALSWITTADCLGWRDEAADLKTGPMKVRMYRACRACPKFTKTQEQDDAE